LKGIVITLPSVHHISLAYYRKISTLEKFKVYVPTVREICFFLIHVYFTYTIIRCIMSRKTRDTPSLVVENSSLTRVSSPSRDYLERLSRLSRVPLEIISSPSREALERLSRLSRVPLEIISRGSRDYLEFLSSFWYLESIVVLFSCY
jgi:hypothetical protein